MSNLQSVISEAFEKLRGAISEEDARLFASTELVDVWSAAREIEIVQRKTKTLQNLRRIEPLLKGVGSYAKVMEVLCNGIGSYAKVMEVLCNGTPFLSYIWAPIKLMLQLASPHREVFDILLAAYADIGNALPRFDQCQNGFFEDKGFQSVLGTVYRDILEFHQRTYKFFRRRVWRILFLPLWKDFGSRFDSIIESLRNQRDFVNNEVASINIIESKEARIKAQIEMQERNKRTLERIENDEKTRRILQLQHSVAWLLVDDSIQENELYRLSRRRHDKTCQWIAKEPILRAWVMNDAKEPLLWLNGKPGAGKSVICSYIIQNISEIPGLSPCYYFCSSQETGNLSTHVLRTVALQLLRQRLELASLIANEFVYLGFNCGITQLKIMVPKLLEIVPYTRIIIDGLDECSTENQKAVLRDLQALCLRPGVQCKILFSSRKEVLIRDKLSGKPQISLDRRMEVELDIRSYVKYNIKQLLTTDGVLLGRLESIVSEKSDGMFLWVRLVIDELRFCYSDKDLEQRATNLPRGLTKAYERILNRIMNDNLPSFQRSLAMKILEWMACSYRPLKVYEILDGISLGPKTTTILGTTKIRKEVLDLCRPLIEEGPSNTIEFVHFSAKDYILEKGYGLEDEPFISISDAHYNISFSCVAYLNSSLALLPVNSTDQDRASSIVQGRHGLQLYANQFWFKHLMTYCSQGHPWVPTDLMMQLEQLLRFEKDHSFGIASTKEPSTDRNVELAVLNEVPALKRLISKILHFRDNLNQSNAFEISPAETSFNSCAKDPTHFSATRHHYLVMLEYLLSGEGSHLLTSSDRNHLRTFRETYRASAFVCRYLHCSKATDGFDSLQQRDAHEACHQRKFHCSHPSCVYFQIGFATRSTLIKHNERYHSAVTDSGSFFKAIEAQKRKRVPGTPSVSSNHIEAPADIEKQQKRYLGAQDQQLINEPSNDPTSDLLGWPNTILIQERIGSISNIIVNLCFAYMHHRNQFTVNEVVEVATELERCSLLKSLNKVGYRKEIQRRLMQLLAQVIDNGAHNEPPIDKVMPQSQSYILIHSSSTSASDDTTTGADTDSKTLNAIRKSDDRLLPESQTGGYNLLSSKRRSHIKEESSIQYGAPNRYLCRNIIQNKSLDHLGDGFKSHQRCEWVFSVLEVPQLYFDVFQLNIISSRMLLGPFSETAPELMSRLLTTYPQCRAAFFPWLSCHDKSSKYDNFQLFDRPGNAADSFHFTNPGVYGNSLKRSYEAANSTLGSCTQNIELNFRYFFWCSRPIHNKENSRSPPAHPVNDVEEFNHVFNTFLNFGIERQTSEATPIHWGGNFRRELLIQLVNKRHCQKSLDKLVDTGDNSSTQVPASTSGFYQTLCSSRDHPAKRRRLTKDDDEGDDAGEGGGSQRRQPDRLSSTNLVSNRRFACPFHKHSPEIFRLENGFGACIRPGWAEVAKLKEHLYRKHLHWLQCQRCRVPFSSQNKLDEHADAPIICKSRGRELLDGMSIEAYLDIRKKKRCLPGQGEREKWVEIFQVLFPQAIVPGCPYVDPDFEYSLSMAHGRRSASGMNIDSPLSKEFNVPGTILKSSPFQKLQQQLPENVANTTQESQSADSVPLQEAEHATPDSAIGQSATMFSTLEDPFQEYRDMDMSFDMGENWPINSSQPTNDFDVTSLPHPWATYGSTSSGATAPSLSGYGSSSAGKTFGDNSSGVTGFSSSSGFGSSSTGRTFGDNYSSVTALSSSRLGSGSTSNISCSCLGKHHCKNPSPAPIPSSRVATPQANDPTIVALLESVQSLRRTVLALEKRVDAKETSSDPDQPP